MYLHNWTHWLQIKLMPIQNHGVENGPGLNDILVTMSSPVCIGGAFELTSIHGIRIVHGSLVKPHGPCDDFHDEADAAQYAQDNDVDGGPLVCGV